MRSSFIIASKHPAFGKLYLGRSGPVVGKSHALRFALQSLAQDRITFWQGLVEKDSLDPKFFNNLYVETV